MLKRLLIITLLTLLSSTASAEFIGPCSFDTLITVDQMKAMKSDSRVSLVGALISQVADEHYTFQDDSGKMVVEIDDDELKGLIVTPESKLRIRGEVDEDDYNSQLEVDCVEIVE